MKKNTNLFALAMTILALFCISCSKKNDVEAPSSIVTTEDAAASISDALSSDFANATGSSVGIANKQVNLANARLEGSSARTEASACGVLKDTSTTISSASGRKITFSWTGRFQALLNCTGNFIKVPNSVNFVITSTGNSSGLFLNSNGSSSANFTFTGLGLPEYALTGNYARQSSIVKKSDNKSFSGNTTVNVTGLAINKTTLKISGGTGTFTVNGQLVAGSAYSYSGTFTYVSDTTVILVIGADTYTLDLDTGKATKS